MRVGVDFLKIKIKSNECFCGSSHRKEFWESFYRENTISVGQTYINLDNNLHLRLERHENGPVFLIILHEIVNNPYFISIASSFIYDFVKLLVKTDNQNNNSFYYEISFRKENHKTKETIDSNIKFGANNIPNVDLIVEEINKSLKDLNS